jgi:hypothetical protein
MSSKLNTAIAVAGIDIGKRSLGRVHWSGIPLTTGSECRYGSLLLHRDGLASSNSLPVSGAHSSTLRRQPIHLTCHSGDT